VNQLNQQLQLRQIQTSHLRTNLTQLSKLKKLLDQIRKPIIKKQKLRPAKKETESWMYSTIAQKKKLNQRLKNQSQSHLLWYTIKKCQIVG
jgi:hypothetical protein